jgi:hypothetical protein
MPRLPLAGLLASLVSLSIAIAGEPLELDWEKLIPVEAGSGPVVHGIVQHGQLAKPAPSSGLAPLVTSLDGAKVRIGGYMVPLDFEGAGVTSFLLVPYVGACIHVPPPPANQIIYVESGQSIEIDNPFEPVWVTGTLSTQPLATELADVGYRLAAEDVTSSAGPMRSSIGAYMAGQQP